MSTEALLKLAASPVMATEAEAEVFILLVPTTEPLASPVASTDAIPEFSPERAPFFVVH